MKDKKYFRDSDDAKFIIEFVFNSYAQKRGSRSRVKITYDTIKEKLANKLPTDARIVAQHKKWVEDPVNYLYKDHPVHKLAQMYFGDPVELSVRNLDELEFGIVSKPIQDAIIERVPVKSVKQISQGYNSIDDFAVPTEVLSLIKDTRKTLYLETVERGRKGVEISTRLFVFMLAQVPMKFRGENVQCNIDITLEEIAKLIFPANNDRGHFYKKSKHEELLKEAFRELNTMTIELSNRKLFSPVFVREQPDYSNLNSKALIIVQWPDKSDRGMRVNLQELIESGFKNRWKFDLCLSLYKYWDEGKRRNGGKRIFGTVPEVKRNKDGYILDSNDNLVMDKNGRPVKAWNHPRAVRTGGVDCNDAVKHLDWLTADDLYEMAFSKKTINDNKGTKHRSIYKKKIREYVDEMTNNNVWHLEVNADEYGKGKLVELWVETDDKLLNS